MSVESFERFKKEYNVPNLKLVLSLEKESKFPEKSLAGYLGMRFAEFGAEELRETERDIDSKEKAYLINISPPYPKTQSDKIKLGDNYYAIVVGTVIEFMADAANKGVFNKPEYVREHNARIRGSKNFYPLYSDPVDVQVIKNEYWEQLRRLAEENPTLTTLFTTNYHLMPNYIQWHIEHSGSFELIKNRVVSIYLSVASKLLNSP
jgi:hypothetical protein